jgi:hypothetical protein
LQALAKALDGSTEPPVDQRQWRDALGMLD